MSFVADATTKTNGCDGGGGGSGNGSSGDSDGDDDALRVEAAAACR